MNNDISNVIEPLNKQYGIIQVPYIFLKLAGDYNTAALLNRIVYLADRATRDDGFFHKTFDEWQNEMYLSEYQVTRSVKKLKEMNLVETTVKKVDGTPKNHYKVNFEQLVFQMIKINNKILLNKSEEN